MARMKSEQVSTLMWVLVAGLLSQNLVIPVIARSFEDQKNYYSPPRGHNSPSHTPSHGSGGAGGHHGTPPSHGSYNPTPSTPPGGNCGTPPQEPSTPSTPSDPPSGGGGYYNPPPTYGGGSPPTPVTVSPPTTPYSSPPTTPYLSPPIDPGTPNVPSPPYQPDPNSPFIGTCNYWRTHPGVIWGLLGWWGTLGSAFGATTVPGFGANMSLQQALSNTHTDGLGALYREGTASYLNSMVNSRFPFTTKQVRENFVAALGSNKAASAQAHLFKLANEGRLKPRT